MYIVAIAWLYVAVLMALAERSIVGGFLTLLFYGIAPLALFLWLMGALARRRSGDELVGKKSRGDDRSHTETDQ